MARRRPKPPRYKVISPLALAATDCDPPPESRCDVSPAKVRFTSEMRAMSSRGSEAGLRAYPCSACSGWHLTSKAARLATDKTAAGTPGDDKE